METLFTVGPYRVIRQLGAGGMGAVFEAVHQTISRRVAIKVLHAEYARNTEFTARFFNEARAVNVVDHPGLVQVSDYGQLPDGTAYIVMELLKGESLAKRLGRSEAPLSFVQVLQIVWQLADSLVAAHAKGIVHRDLKPDNVMLVPDPHMPTGERTKLLDFGIAKVSGDPADPSVVKTRANAVMGTPTYMSPEQCRGGQDIDDRADVYSLGIMLYVMLSGRPPFIGEGPGEIIGKHLFVQPPSVLSIAPAVPVELAELVHRLLNKDRTQRPVMHQVRTQVEELLARASAQVHPADRAVPTASSRTAYDPVRPLPTTLGNASSETRAGAEQRRWIRVGAGATVSALALVAFLGLSGRPPPAHPPVATARMRPARPEEKLVTVRVDSEPGSAAIIRVSDGQLLGRTPWQQQQPAQPGELLVHLQLAGFADQGVTIDLSRDSDSHQVLHPLDPKPLPAVMDPKPPLSSHRLAGHSVRPATAGVPPITRKNPPNEPPPVED